MGEEAALKAELDRLEAQRYSEYAEQNESTEANAVNFKSNLTVYTFTNGKVTTDVYRGWKDCNVKFSYDKSQRSGTFKKYGTGKFKAWQLANPSLNSVKYTPAGITLNCAARLQSNFRIFKSVVGSENEWTNVQLFL